MSLYYHHFLIIIFFSIYQFRMELSLPIIHWIIQYISLIATVVGYILLTCQPKPISTISCIEKRNTLLRRKNIPLPHFIIYNNDEYKYYARIYLHDKQSDTNPQIKTHGQNITHAQFYYQNITTGNSKRRKTRCLCGLPAFRRLLELVSYDCLFLINSVFFPPHLSLKSTDVRSFHIVSTAFRTSIEPSKHNRTRIFYEPFPSAKLICSSQYFSTRCINSSATITWRSDSSLLAM